VTFHERKKERTEYYMRFVFGWKQRPCTACNGSGRYDHNNSPRCGGCNGTGKERYKDKRADFHTVAAGNTVEEVRGITA
jgi:DnaJ-class molecular chaperone